jgi:hypothetical protein
LLADLSCDPVNPSQENSRMSPLRDPRWPW